MFHTNEVLVDEVLVDEEIVATLTKLWPSAKTGVMEEITQGDHQITGVVGEGGAERPDPSRSVTYASWRSRRARVRREANAPRSKAELEKSYAAIARQVRTIAGQSSVQGSITDCGVDRVKELFARHCAVHVLDDLSERGRRIGRARVVRRNGDLGMVPEGVVGR
jgi:hypothetical protein